MKSVQTTVLVPTVHRAVLALALMVVTTSTCTAQPDDLQPKGGSVFWETSPYTREAAAVQLVGAAMDPFTAAAMIGGERKTQFVWGLPHQPSQPKLLLAPKLNPRLRAAIRDDQPLPDLRNKLPEDITDQDRVEIHYYAEALVNAAKFSPRAFANSAKENKFVTFAHLKHHSLKYRGQVIPVTGKLIRVRKYDPPEAARKQFLIPHMYEGWVVMDTHKEQPVTVHFVELPEKIQLGETLDYRVQFNGYFLKRWRFPVPNNEERISLLFVTPTVKVLPQPQGPNPAAAFSDSVITGAIVVLIMGVLTIIGMGLLNWWYRRDDARIHERLSDLRAKNANLPDEDAPAPLAQRVEPDPAPETNATKQDNP